MMQRISIFVFSLLTLAGLMLSSNSYSQVSLNGIVDMNDYAGSQPGLIKGVSRVPAKEKPLIRHVYMVSHDMMALIIDERACITSNLKPYQKQDNDSMIMTGYHGLSKLLVRKGEAAGYLCGWQNNWYRPFDQLSGEKINTAWISDPSHFLIRSTDDPQYNNGIHPEAVYRKSRPDERVHISRNHQATLRHMVYLL